MKRLIFVLPMLFFAANIFSQTFEMYKGDTINRMDNKELKQGVWKYFFDDKTTLKKEGCFVDNKKHGIWKLYYQDGKILTEMTYASGIAKGYAKAYYPNGNVMEEGFWDVNHWTGDYVAYYENGNKFYVWKYNDDGYRTGNQKYYHPNGNLFIEGDWKDGKRDGMLREFNEDGMVFIEKIFNAGKLASSTLVNADPKNLSASKNQTSLSDDELLQIFDGTGIFKLMTNGKIEREGEFDKGKLIDGNIYFYDEEGNLERTEVYKEGKLVK